MKNSVKNTEKISTVDLFSAGHDAFSWLIRDLGMQEAIRSVETASILFGDAVACDLLWSVVRGNRKQPSSTKLTAKDIRCKDDVLQKLATKTIQAKLNIRAGGKLGLNTFKRSKKRDN